MKTISIKMKNYKNEVSIINNNDIERRILKLILLAFGILSIFYVLFLGNMIFNIVERRNMEAEARNLSNEVQDLEQKYLSMSSNLDLQSAYALGFKEVTPNFATRTSLGFVSKDNSNEI